MHTSGFGSPTPSNAIPRGTPRMTLELSKTRTTYPESILSIAITMTAGAENIVILLLYFGWWPYLF
jgi:hypothetical protein